MTLPGLQKWTDITSQLWKQDRNTRKAYKYEIPSDSGATMYVISRKHGSPYETIVKREDEELELIARDPDDDERVQVFPLSEDGYKRYRVVSSMISDGTSNATNPASAAKTARLHAEGLFGESLPAANFEGAFSMQRDEKYNSPYRGSINDTFAGRIRHTSKVAMGQDPHSQLGPGGILVALALVGGAGILGMHLLTKKIGKLNG